MALTEDNDLSNRLAYFENNNPVNNPYWDGLFKGLREVVWNTIGEIPFEITSGIICDCFNPIRDSFTGIIIRSRFEQFEIYCKSNGIKFFINDNGNYIVSKDWDNYCYNNGKLYKKLIK